MDPLAFEKLLSDALSEPQNADVRDRILQMIASSASLNRIRDDWLRLDLALRAALEAGPCGIDWAVLKQRIVAAIHSL